MTPKQVALKALESPRLQSKPISATCLEPSEFKRGCIRPYNCPRYVASIFFKVMLWYNSQSSHIMQSNFPWL
eukprot:5710083-Amphidinium_carterae.2